MQTDENFVIAFGDMETFYDEPGERGWILEGYKHGLANTSVIITETSPGGGPPLHLHHTEEVHVLPECQIRYVIGDRRIQVNGPCVVRIPAKAPHTFVNMGSETVSITCFWPAYNFWPNYEELGPNPLLD